MLRNNKAYRGKKCGGIAFIALAIMTITFFIILISHGTAEWWQNESIFGKGHGNNKYCERKRWDEFLVERSNSVSNLGFIILGQLILIVFIFDVCHLHTMNANGHRQSNAVLLFPIWSLFYGTSMIFLGLTSFAYHASLTYNMQILDVVFIYVTILCICCIIVVQLAHMIDMKWMMQRIEYYQKSVALSVTNAVIALAFVLLITFLFIHVHPFRANNDSKDVVSWSGIAIFSFAFIFYLSAFTYLTDVNVTKSFKYFVVTIICIAGGFTFRQVEMFYCTDQDALFQFHAIFHVLVAIGLTSAYFSARSISLNVSGHKIMGIDEMQLISPEKERESILGLKQQLRMSLSMNENQKIDRQIINV